MDFIIFLPRRAENRIVAQALVARRAGIDPVVIVGSLNTFMTPDRLREIEQLYHSAREASVDDRVALLDRADPQLRREVESLLAREDDRMILDGSAQLSDDPTLLHRGTLLGPYQVESKLGEGGMGEVFRAVDTRLGRPVAIKLAHQEFNARFEREARAISSLNHPHICTLYDVGPNYLVMELLEGDTLAARLKNGPLPLEQALVCARQIAGALAEAHERGIVHRDLKPGNIMLTKSGVKVLDFGLATLEGSETLTGSHMVMGTPAYMAPEQREGKPADARTDLYSFGCVLNEMLTGTRATPQRKRIPSRSLEMVVSRCLETDPAQRWQTAAELARALGAVPRAERNRVRMGAAAAIAVAIVIAVVAAGFFYFRATPKLTDKDTIVLADFTNTTGDPVFDDTLRQGLAVQLEQSPFLSLVSAERIQKALPLMGQRADARLTPQLAREVCQRTGGAAVLSGSIAAIGNQFVLGLRAANCGTGDVLDEEQEQASGKEGVLNALSRIASKFRRRAGEALATINKHSTPLAEATTPSLEALKAYSTATRVNLTSGTPAALPLYQRAVEIDPKFAIANAYLGLMYSNLGESVRSLESTTRAYQLRDRASDLERFFIDFTYHRQVTGNLEKALQALELWAQTYPRDFIAHGLIGGFSTAGTGRYEKMIEESKISIGLDPDPVYAWSSLAGGYFCLDRFAEARNTLDQAAARKVDMPQFLIFRYKLAFIKSDKAEMDRQAALAKGKRGAEDSMSHSEALVLAQAGRLQEARGMSRRAVDLAQQSGRREAAATYESGAAVWEAFYGNVAEARRSAMAALDLSKGRDVEYAVAFALALAGDTARSQTLAGDLDKRFPEDTSVQYNYLPALRGLFALKQGEPRKAIELLQSAAPYELSEPGITFFVGEFGALYPAYVRGEAYLAAHQNTEAAAEFQKFLDHPGIVFADPAGAMARLQRGRAFALAGDKTKAITAYQDFLALWKDADPGIPILAQAKAEYAELR
jgi:tetratricopeptide (TPR) repeat protein/predicted Ser/Thr protein kinase